MSHVPMVAPWVGAVDGMHALGGRGLVVGGLVVSRSDDCKRASRVAKLSFD